MNWEIDAELRATQYEQEKSPLDDIVTLSYIMLKPDGWLASADKHIHEVFRQNLLPPPGSMKILFTFDEALAFYPKDSVWCTKYGQKRLDALLQLNRLKEDPVPTALALGHEILHNMAEYLSSGPCEIFLFEMKGAVSFGRAMVGATVPKDALPHTLRATFSKDSVEVASLERRALRNVAHAPDDENVAEELVQLSRLACITTKEREALSSLVRRAFPHKAHLLA